MPAEPKPVDPSTLRVLQVIPILAMGGLERVATGLTLGLRPFVARVAVAGRTGVKKLGSAEIEGPLRDGGVTVYHIPRARGRLVDVARAGIALARILRHERPDVIHAHNPVGGAAASIARALSLRSGTAIVTTYHGVEPHRLARATRVLSLTSDLVVGVGPTTTRALKQIGLREDRSDTVYNAFSLKLTRSAAEVREEFGVPTDAQLVVTVGRYAREKNQALLLDALALLLPHRPSLHALLVGVGVLEDELRAQTFALGIADRVQITGPRADAQDIIRASDVFVLSSASEGLPLVLLESMALGVPVISTNVGGVGDAVVDGETGLLARPGDAAALADGLGRLLDDEALRVRLATAGAAWARANCTEEAMVRRYLALYVQALARRRRGR
jgi:glycosyltransferase involved in cell wall biosynthesis